MAAELKITQVKSTIGVRHQDVTTLKGLGLRGVGSIVVVKNTPSFRGAVKKVLYLLKVEDHG
jgi:large subunit ribosomal protein L30